MNLWASDKGGYYSGAFLSGTCEMMPVSKPEIVITYCTQCQWLLRAAWLAQELLSTFAEDLGRVALEPVYGITLAWLLFHETPTVRMLLGGALIIVAIVVSSRMGSGAPAKPVLDAGAH